MEDEVKEYQQMINKMIKALDGTGKPFKVKWQIALPGLLTMAFGWAFSSYMIATDWARNGFISLFGLAGVTLGIFICFVGYIVSHKGLRGFWM